MKILFCLGSMTKGGAERVIANLSNEFINKYEVSIIVTPPDKSMYELNKKINYYTLDNKNDNNGIIFRTLKRIKKIIEIVRMDNPDIIISLLPEPTFRMMLANIFLHKKVIISVRNDPKTEYNSLIKKILVKILYSKANGFIFQTEEAKGWFNKKIQAKSIVIPNPINKDFIVNPYIGARDKEIVSVGRLTKQKNQKLLLGAFKRVLLKYPEYILKIYGSGELENELKEYCIKNNIEKNVYFMGDQNNIKNLIYKAKMFVLSSDYEGMPNALMEAMALGVPSIATDCPCGGPKFLINNKINGILVPTNNEDELFNAMIQLIENIQLSNKISKESNKICVRLNPNKINKIWEEYILNIVKMEKIK